MRPAAAGADDACDALLPAEASCAADVTGAPASEPASSADLALLPAPTGDAAAGSDPRPTQRRPSTQQTPATSAGPAHRRWAGWPSLRLSRRAVAAVVLGQTLAVLLTGTGVTSQLLSTEHHIDMPTAQLFLNYVLLLVIYAPVLLRRRGWPDVRAVARSRGGYYLLLGIIDVEANYAVVRAYQYTTLTSVQLLDCFTIPCVMLLTWRFLRQRYRLWHIVAVVVCIAGLGLLVVSDLDNRQGQTAPDPLLGDLLCLLGAVLYAVSNVSQEYLVKQHDRVEFLAMIGACGTLVAGVQMAAVEHTALAAADWSAGAVPALIVGFALCMFALYSLVPVLLVWSGATMLNLSLLASDAYSMLFGVFLFRFSLTWLYFLASAIIVLGLLAYNAAPPLQDRPVVCVRAACGADGLASGRDPPAVSAV